MEQNNNSEKKTKWGAKHSDSDYEYVNSLSKSALPILIWSLVIGAGLLAFAWFRYKELDRWQQSYTTINMTSIEHLCYKIGGIWLFPALMAIFGLIIVVMGVRKYKHRQQLKEL